ncbi:MAG TPA: NADAR family protein [Ktedonobacterales bacterium]
MPYLNRTYRLVDGERVEGSWRHVFINNGGLYFLADLKVYADGMIDCWGLVDLATFRQKVASGWVATTYVQGAYANVHQLVTWHFDQPESWLTPQQLIAEVADEIEHLAGRPTSEDRCLAVLETYLDDPTDEHLAALRDAYFSVPEHLRMYLLGDQDSKDVPLRTLITPVGEVLVGFPDDDSVMQPSDHVAAREYFRQRRDERRQMQVAPPPWEDDAVASSPSVIRFDKHDGGKPYMSNEYPAPIVLEEGTFPTVEHAYWASATTDPDVRDRIVHAPTAREARRIGESAPLRTDWSVVRLSVMLRLVREKFHQHPDLAAQLIATGDGRLVNGVDLSRFWGNYRQGRNWLGRILELVRAELCENAFAETDSSAT